MKKLLLTAVSALALATPALAANSTSTVTQSGAAQNATVMQSGSQRGGASTITQSGSTNTASVTQSDDNTGNPAPANRSTVTQASTGNTATVKQTQETDRKSVV